MKQLIFFVCVFTPFLGTAQDFGKAIVFNDLDSALMDPEHAQTLILDSDTIIEISPSIVKLTNLRGLSLSYNQGINLVDLFDKLSQLPRLELLNLSDCQIEFLPSNISRLTHLKKLMLINNKLTELPPEMKQMSKLKEVIFGQHPGDFRRLTEEQKLQMLSLLPRTKILLTEYGGGTHGHYRLGARTVRVTKTNLWPNK